LALTARYLADKSALSRFDHPEVNRRLRPLLEQRQIATCAIIDLEVLFSSRSLKDYEGVLEERHQLQDVPIVPEIMSRAIDAQHELARTGHHRVSIPDLIIAATAEAAGLTVLHYDSDFDSIASVTGNQTEWVVPQGSI